MAWAPNYVTPSDLTSFVRITDNTDDTQVGLAIAAASRAVDRATHRQFGLVSVAEARTYTPWFDHRTERWTVPIDDLMSAVGLVVQLDTAGDETYATTITATSFRPSNAAAWSRPWTQLVILPAASQPDDHDHGVKVTALWGWSAVPDAVKEATLLQASRLLARRDSPFGVAGSPQTGSELRLLAKVDPDVAVALRPYERHVNTAVFA